MALSLKGWLATHSEPKDHTCCCSNPPAMALNVAQAEELRRLAADVNDAVEARIRGERGAIERIRRTTQSVQMSGMGPFEYWAHQLWQPLKNICLVMAQEMGVLPRLNAHDGPATAQDIARSLSSEDLLICE